MKDQLQQYIDQVGLRQVLETLSEVCDDKAKEQQFKDITKRWLKAAIHLSQLAGKKFTQGL